MLLCHAVSHHSLPMKTLRESQTSDEPSPCSQASAPVWLCQKSGRTRDETGAGKTVTDEARTRMPTGDCCYSSPPGRNAARMSLLLFAISSSVRLRRGPLTLGCGSVGG